MWGSLFGATEQNLLKLLERIIDDPTLGVSALPEAQTHNQLVIY
jgi:hypothetical protein